MATFDLIFTGVHWVRSGSSTLVGYNVVITKQGWLDEVGPVVLVWDTTYLPWQPGG